MNWVDVMGYLAPRFTRQWLRERALLGIQQRSYEAASASQYRRVMTNMASGDGVMNATGDKLRQISRQLDENHDLVVAIFDDIVNNTVGAGVRVAPMVRLADGTLAESVNDRIAELWDEWGQAPETTGDFGMEAMEAMVVRSMMRDGEIFMQLVKNPTFAYRGPVPFALELIEADLVPFEYNDPGRNILHGVQNNAWNSPIGYWVLKNHPGDPLYATVGTTDIKFVAAEAMMHAKFTRRLRQRRGVPALHAVLNRLQDLKDYEESERIAAKVAADMTAFIQRGSEYNAATNAAVNEYGRRELTMQAGAIFELQVGESVGTIKSDRPNTGLVAFRDGMLRAVAGGTGTRFSSISRNYNGTYSAQRQELVEGAIAYRRIFAYLVRKFYRPMYAGFIDQAILSGALRLPLRQLDAASLRRADFRAPALPWIDPAKEAAAYQTLVTAGLESRQEIMRQRGRDPAKVWEELEEETASGIFASQVDGGEIAFGSAAGGDPPADDPSDDPAGDAEAA